MQPSTLLLYLTACLAVTLTPGPTMLLALANGTSRNFRIVGMGMLGAALSDLILIGAVGIGLGTLLAASETLFSCVKWLGVLYLVQLGIQMWKQEPILLLRQSPVSARTSFFRSLFVSLSNPKGLLFFSAFLPQFITPSRPQAPQYATLGMATALLDMAVMACYALGGAQAARMLTIRGLRRLNRICASVFLSLAALLAVYRRANA